MYCESKISHIYHGDVEHIKPKSEFPDLEFDWQNLGIACAKCNGIKSNKFTGDTPFIDSYIDNPEEHLIAWGALIRSKKGSERGRLTIHEIGLNRLCLIERRMEKIEQIEHAIQAYCKNENEKLRNLALDELKNLAESHAEYSFFVKSFLVAHDIYEEN